MSDIITLEERLYTVGTLRVEDQERIRQLVGGVGITRELDRNLISVRGTPEEHALIAAYLFGARGEPIRYYQRNLHFSGVTFP